MELRCLKREVDVWKFINKKRGKRIWRNNNIETKEWKQHFMNLLSEWILRWMHKKRRK